MYWSCSIMQSTCPSLIHPTAIIFSGAHLLYRTRRPLRTPLSWMWSFFYRKYFLKHLLCPPLRAIENGHLTIDIIIRVECIENAWNKTPGPKPLSTFWNFKIPLWNYNSITIIQQHLIIILWQWRQEYRNNYQVLLAWWDIRIRDIGS